MTGLAMRDSPFRSATENEALREIHEAIGRFAVAFEQVCAGMRSAIVLALERRGLANQPLAHLLVARQSARSLALLLTAIYHEFNPDDTKGQESLKCAVKRIEKLIERRNQVIHAPWILGSLEQDSVDFPFVQALLFRCKKHGLQVEQLHYEPSDFNSLTDEATELQVYLQRLLICINQPRFKLSEMFDRPTGRPG